MYCKVNPSKPCGGCQNCRVFTSLDIVKRLKIEHSKRPFAAFLTWTYSDEFLPIFSGKAQLYSLELDACIDRLKKVVPGKIVVFAVGEYGGRLFGSDKATRDIHPHYHLAVFSDDPNFYNYIRSSSEKAWKFGHSHCLMLSQSLMSYIAGYTLKKLTSEKDMNKVKGLRIEPEFARFPRNPCLGDVKEEYVENIEHFGWIDKIIINGKETSLPKSLRLRIEKEFILFGTHGFLDGVEVCDIDVYKHNKAVVREEKFQRLQEKKMQNLQSIKNEKGVSESEARALLSLSNKQKRKNFEIMLDLKKCTKKERIL